MSNNVKLLSIDSIIEDEFNKFITKIETDLKVSKSAVESIVMRSLEQQDESDVINLIKKRMNDGRKDYGRLDLKNDKRDFSVEMIEEIADALIYCACLIKNEKQ